MIVDKPAFIKQLRATASGLAPLTKSTVAGASTWNGTEYVKIDKSQRPNPYALSWWAMLGAIADLLEAQESPPSKKQISYLEGLLFGGMGSLNDLTFDTQAGGDIARTVNERLEKQRRVLYDSFKHD
jgi:hypothetical protein